MQRSTDAPAQNLEPSRHILEGSTPRSRGNSDYTAFCSEGDSRRGPPRTRAPGPFWVPPCPGVITTVQSIEIQGGTQDVGNVDT